MDWNYLGNRRAVEHLAQNIASENAGHAYLFTGPSGIGRRTLALRLAQALNCPSPTAPGEACKKCRTCRQIENMTHPDLFVIKAEKAGGTLRIDQVRELLHKLAFAPYESKYRVAILLRFEEAHISAMNALLKTLEEPADRAVIILTAESQESILPTIISRCEILRLRLMSMKELCEGLQSHWDIPFQNAELLAHLSAGRPGDAIRMHLDATMLENRKTWLEAHGNLCRASRVERFSFVEKMTKDPGTIRTGLITWLSLWHDILFVSLNSNRPVVNLDQQDQISLLAEELDSSIAFHMLGRLEKTIELLDKYINSRLALEVLMLDLPRIGSSQA